MTKTPSRLRTWARPVRIGEILFAGMFLIAAAALSITNAMAAEATELEWEDLLPPGEEELLDQMYLDYFAELERRTRPSLGMGLNLFDYEPSIDSIEEGSELDQMEQLGTFNVVSALDGETVRIPGYIVPFDFSPDDVYTEFLFAPYFGACIHSPPPPPNQIIYVTIDEPSVIRDIYRPLWIEGVLTTQRNKNELGDAAYTLRLSKVTPYEG